MLLTSLPVASAAAAEVFQLYRMRWQIELAFKRLKSLGGFAGRSARLSPLRTLHRWSAVARVCGGHGCWPIGTCNWHCSPDRNAPHVGQAHQGTAQAFRATKNEAIPGRHRPMRTILAPGAEPWPFYFFARVTICVGLTKRSAISNHTRVVIM